MNIKALPIVGSAFFVAFVLWSRRFAVPLQKESSPLQGVHLSQVHQQSKKYTSRARSAQQSYVGALETSAPPKAPLKTLTKL